MHKKNLPLLVIFFNRPNVLRRQLRALKQFKPTSIYFSADGPRVSNEKDLQKLNLCKQMIATEIDWACNLHFNYSEKNYGCDQFVPKAIDWFFSNEEAGIVLEDDCLISKDFYTFSSILLDKYASDDRVMSISASNFQSKKWGEGDYYFSRYPANWAWATWRRAWEHFDSGMQGLDQFTGPDGGFNRIELVYFRVVNIRFGMQSGCIPYGKEMVFPLPLTLIYQPILDLVKPQPILRSVPKPMLCRSIL